MSDKTGSDEKLSDLIGSTNYKINENLKLNYDFSIDQNYNEFNYNEVGTEYDNGTLNLSFNYLQVRINILVTKIILKLN